MKKIHWLSAYSVLLVLGSAFLGGYGTLQVFTLGLHHSEHRALEQLRESRKISHSERDLQFFALNMYWEARGEGLAGMEDVGHVVLNRLHDGSFGDTIYEIVTFKNEKTCAFTWWCDGRADTPTNKKRWEDALYLAKLMLDGTIWQDTTGGAKWYHAEDLPVSKVRWAYIGNQTVTRNGHIFYSHALTDSEAKVLKSHDTEVKVAQK